VVHAWDAVLAPGARCGTRGSLRVEAFGLSFAPVTGTWRWRLSFAPGYDDARAWVSPGRASAISDSR